MSTLSSASTDAEIYAAFDDNASFEEDSSPAKAQAYLTACRIILRRQPSMVSSDGHTVSFDPNLIAAELERARQWLAANRSGGGNRYLSFTGLRD